MDGSHQECAKGGGSVMSAAVEAERTVGAPNCGTRAAKVCGALERAVASAAAASAGVATEAEGRSAACVIATDALTTIDPDLREVMFTADGETDAAAAVALMNELLKALKSVVFAVRAGSDSVGKETERVETSGGLKAGGAGGDRAGGGGRGAGAGTTGDGLATGGGGGLGRRGGGGEGGGGLGFGGGGLGGSGEGGCGGGGEHVPVAMHEAGGGLGGDGGDGGGGAGTGGGGDGGLGDGGLGAAGGGGGGDGRGGGGGGGSGDSGGGVPCAATVMVIGVTVNQRDLLATANALTVTGPGVEGRRRLAWGGKGEGHFISSGGQASAVRNRSEAGGDSKLHALTQC